MLQLNSLGICSIVLHPAAILSHQTIPHSMSTSLYLPPASDSPLFLPVIPLLTPLFSPFFPPVTCSSPTPSCTLTRTGRDFPPSFAYTAKHIYKHLFRIFAHLYHAHFEHVLHLSIEAHFNSLFAHFLAFGKEFELLNLGELMTPQGQGQGVWGLVERWREMGVLES